jgi:phytanoyl-CoA hydroxylase
MNRKLDFDQNGYAVVPSFLSQNEVTEVITRLDQFIAETVPNLPAAHVFYEDKEDRSSLKQLQQIQKYDSWFDDLFNGKPRAIAEELLGSEVTGENMQYFNKPPGIGQPTPAHQDGYYFKLDPPEALTMWMALEEVDEENGCVRYVKSSHLDGMRPHGQTGTLGFSQGITDFGTNDDLARESPMPARPGDLLAHHALTIHRADGNHSLTRTRRALGFIFYSVNAKPDLAARETYERQLAEQQAGKI